MKPTPSKPWLILFGLQLILIGVLFYSFLFGDFYFAYTDIGLIGVGINRGQIPINFMQSGSHGLLNFVCNDGFSL